MQGTLREAKLIGRKDDRYETGPQANTQKYITQIKPVYIRPYQSSCFDKD